MVNNENGGSTFIWSIVNKAHIKKKKITFVNNVILSCIYLLLSVFRLLLDIPPYKHLTEFQCMFLVYFCVRLIDKHHPESDVFHSVLIFLDLHEVIL
jgi:hypothetical protein